jgi:cytochrome c55X
MTASRPTASRPSSLAAMALLVLSPVPGLALEPAREAALGDLVRQDCGSCHGLSLKGGLGRPLRPEALAAMDVEGIAAIILDGVPGTPMPPWRGLISPDEAKWIAAQLKKGALHEAP